MDNAINEKTLVEKGYWISTDKSLIDFSCVHRYLDKESYWARGIKAARLRKAIDNSLCFAVYKGKELAGFARVVTDSATYAYICDVFVLHPHRGLGVSKWLMQTIINHPDLQGLRRWSLTTADAHTLYEQFGFRAPAHPNRWMEILSPYQSR